MWIVSEKEDKYVASTWGAVVTLTAGVPRQVGYDMGLLCLQSGCTQVTDVPVEKETPVELSIVEEVTVEEVTVEETPLDLEAMTKVQLEEHGRTIGIELDRRKKKADLIEEIQAAQ